MTTRAPACAELTILHRGANRGVGLGAVGGNDDALARGETVGLDHDRQAELAARDHLVRVGSRVADAKTRRGNAVARHERLRERLAALELRGGARGTEDAVARRAKAIDDAEIERQLGTDDREIEPLAIGERAAARRRRSTSIGKDARVARDAGVSRRTSH